jgi:hypothetical protein
VPVALRPSGATSKKLDLRDVSAIDDPRVKLQDDVSAVVMCVNADTLPFEDAES